jgi:hypothetical protein
MKKGKTPKAGKASSDRPEEQKKTSLVLPATLHRKARIRAAQDDTDFRSVVIAALERYLG